MNKFETESSKHAARKKGLMRKLIKEKIIFGNCFIQMPGKLLTPHYPDGESYLAFSGREKVSGEL